MQTETAARNSYKSRAYRVVHDPSDVFAVGAALNAVSLQHAKDDDFPNGLRLEYSGPKDDEPCTVFFYNGKFYKDWPADFGEPGVDCPDPEPWSV